MKLAILRIGPVDPNSIHHIRKTMCEIFPKTVCSISDSEMPTPEDAYNSRRNQFHSSLILAKIHRYDEKLVADRVLGITNADLYVPRLNFVFGEAECPGKTAIISLHRLKPEFYGNSPNPTLVVQRSAKEAVHEIGHTLGLRHCQDSSCVMFFSNNIQMVDTKECQFCEECREEVDKFLALEFP